MIPARAPTSPYLDRPLRTLREACLERARHSAVPLACATCPERALCRRIELKARRRRASVPIPSPRP